MLMSKWLRPIQREPCADWLGAFSAAGTILARPPQRNIAVVSQSCNRKFKRISP
jgi:hypothetical protein